MKAPHATIRQTLSSRLSAALLPVTLLLPTRAALAGEDLPTSEPTLEEPHLDPSRGPDRSGVPLLAGATGVWGAYTLGSLGWIGPRREIAFPLGIGAGALLGAGGTVLLTLNDEVTTREALYVSTSELWGGAMGWSATGLYSSLLDDSATGSKAVIRTRAALGPVGMGAGLLLSAFTPRDDFASLHVAGAAGVLGTAGLRLLWTPDSSSGAVAAATVATGVGLAELATGVLLSRDEPLTANDGYLLAHLTAHATWFGLWTPYLFTPYPDDDQMLGGAVTLTSLGLLGSRLAAQRIDLGFRETTGMSAFGVLGAGLGAGVPMAFGSLDHLEVSPFGILYTTGGMLAGQVLGLSLGGAAHNRFLERPSTLSFMTLGSAFGAAQALGFGLAPYEQGTLTDSQLAGVILTSASIGGFAGFALTPRDSKNDVSRTVVMASSMTWGAWYGAWTGVLLEKDGPELLRLGTIGADVGLAAGVALAAPRFHPSPVRVGYASLCGVGGAALADVVALLVSDDARFLGGANLVGATAGLVAGVATAHRIPVRASSAGATGNLGSEMPGRVIERVARWQPQLSAGPLIAPTAPSRGQIDNAMAFDASNRSQLELAMASGAPSQDPFGSTQAGAPTPIGLSLHLTQPVSW